MISQLPVFPVRIEGHDFTSEQVISGLRHLITDQRFRKMQKVIDGRTHNIIPVVEGLYDLGNVNAVMRSAEALGYQNFHVIQTGERFKIANRVTKGTDHWLDVRKWRTTGQWLADIRDSGYRVAVTHLSDKSIPIHDIDFSVPTAVVFGNEKEGISPEMLANADLSFIIPMSGFAQSFNISVAAAIALYHIVEDRRRRLGQHGDLSSQEQQDLLAYYCLKNVAHAEKILSLAAGPQTSTEL